MMKSTFFNIFLFTVLLASCAPQGTPAQVTATSSIPTTIPMQTATPLVIVSGSGSLREFNEEALMAFAQESGVFLSPSNQPYAEQGIVLDVDGKLWLFDEDAQKMVDMNTDPSWDVQSISKSNGENLTVTLADGKQFDFIDGKWVEIVTEKEVQYAAHNEPMKNAFQAMEEARDEALYVPLRFADGKEVPQGLLAFDSNGLTVTGEVMGWVDPSLYDPVNYTDNNTRMLVVRVANPDGSVVYVPAGIYNNGSKSRIQTVMFYLETPIADTGILETPKTNIEVLLREMWENIDTAYAEDLLHKQIVLAINHDDLPGYEVALRELAKALRGEKADLSKLSAIRYFKMQTVWLPQD